MQEQYAIGYFNLANTITGFFIAQSILFAFALLKEPKLVDFIQQRLWSSLIVLTMTALLYGLTVHACGEVESILLKRLWLDDTIDDDILISYSESAANLRKLFIGMAYIILVIVIGLGLRKKKQKADLEQSVDQKS